jgi:acetylornithine deacetylase/succinyl-diaminopimelate desuccinylase-like protein
MADTSTRESAALEALEDIGLVDLASGMVRYASQIPNEGALARWLYDQLRQMGSWDDVVLQPVVPGRSNLIATVHGKQPGRRLLFNGHLDIPAPYGKWSIDPYDPALADGWLHGVGIGDMKAGVASQLAAAASIAKTGGPAAGSIVVTAVIHHDVCGLGTKFFLASTRDTFHGAINGEPTNLGIQVAHGGALQFEIITRGRAAHTSRLHEGVDAIDHMVDVLAALRGWAPPLSRPSSIDGLPRMVLGRIAGGSSPSRTSDECTVAGDIRFPPEATPEGVLAGLREAIERAGASIPDFEAEVRPTVQQVPFRVDPASEIVQVVARAHRAVTGNDAVISDQLPAGSFVTDSSDLARAGIPAVIYGPADWKTEPDEAVRVEDMMTAARVYAVAALRFLGAVG